MDFSFIKQVLDENPEIKLIRSSQAAITIGFLYQNFKETQKIIVPNENLILSLAGYLEEYDDTLEEDRDIFEVSRLRIERWCSDEHRFLKKYLDQTGTAVHELTTHTERVFKWFEDLKPREFIGTESRFLDILRRLEELVDKSTEDPEVKLKELRRKRKEINAEIREIERSGEVTSYSDVQVSERFSEVSRSARDLLADFKDVEINFKHIVNKVYQVDIQKEKHAGDILAFTLDANDELRESPQGQSFHSFWQFLITDSGTNRINELVNRVYTIMEDKNLEKQDHFLRNLKHYLHQAGKKIVDANHILADKINRVLSERNIFQRKRIKEIIGEIKQMVFDSKEDPPQDDIFMEIDGNPEINLPLERPIRHPEEETTFSEIPEKGETFDTADLGPLYNYFYIDKKELENRISRLLKQFPHISLTQVIDEYPVEKGLSEVIAYYELATADSKARIDRDTTINISYRAGDTERKLNAPQVVFSR